MKTMLDFKFSKVELEYMVSMVQQFLLEIDERRAVEALHYATEAYYNDLKTIKDKLLNLIELQ